MWKNAKYTMRIDTNKNPRYAWLAAPGSNAVPPVTRLCEVVARFPLEVSSARTFPAFSTIVRNGSAARLMMNCSEI